MKFSRGFGWTVSGAGMAFLWSSASLAGFLYLFVIAVEKWFPSNPKVDLSDLPSLAFGILLVLGILAVVVLTTLGGVAGFHASSNGINRTKAS
jgi:hypothetical protein